jgi:phosphotriesterase-related protein
MPLMTVLGDVDPSAIGVVSPHEHIVVDIRNQYTEPVDVFRGNLGRKRVNIRNLDVLSRDPYAVKDNLVLDNRRLAHDELIRFKQAGGGGLVDATSVGIGRNPLLLKKISRSTGLHIIAGCGYYTVDTHPLYLADKTVDDIQSEIVSDIQSGIGDSGIRAGVIGEIGTSAEIHENEKRVLIAAARAQAVTGAGLIVHTYPWGKTGLEALAIAEANGADTFKVSINHVDVVLDADYCKAIMDRGAYIEFDDLGKEYFIDRPNRGYSGGVFARDIDRVKLIKELVDAGYAGHILLSCDVCLKTLLHRYGGWGYDHVLTHIVPMLEEEGISSRDTGTMVKQNPIQFLNIPE